MKSYKDEISSKKITCGEMIGMIIGIGVLFIMISVLFYISESPENKRTVTGHYRKDIEEYYLAQKLSEDENTTLETLKEIVEKHYTAKEGYNLREVVANLSKNQEMLRILADDNDRRIRECVAKNYNTSKEILEYLSNDESEWVRDKVAENQNTSKEILIKLARDESKWVRKSALNKLQENIQIEKVESGD